MTVAHAGPRFPDRLLRAAGYWEPRRVVYTLVLAAVALGWVVFTWPHFAAALTWASLGKLIVLALLANACYCAAYPFDLAIQAVLPRRNRAFWRAAGWLAGMLLAVVLECYWIADEIYPSVS